MPTFKQLGVYPYVGSFELPPIQLLEDSIFRCSVDTVFANAFISTSADGIVYTAFSTLNKTVGITSTFFDSYTTLYPASMFIKIRIELYTNDIEFMPSVSYPIQVVVENNVVQNTLNSSVLSEVNTATKSTVLNTISTVIVSHITAMLHSAVNNEVTTVVDSNVLNGFTASDKSVRRLFSKVRVVYSDLMLDESLQIIANQYGRGSVITDALDNVLVPKYDWFTVGESKLNEANLLPADNSYSIGAWGTSVSNELGVLTIPFVLTITFEARRVENTQIAGDYNDTNFLVDFIMKVWSDETLLDTVVVTDYAEYLYVCTNIYDNVTKMELTVTKISKPSSVAKVVEFYSSIVRDYTDTDVIGINVLEELNYESGTLPIGNISANEIDVVLYNRDRLFDQDNLTSPIRQYVKKNRQVIPHIGIELDTYIIHWEPLGKFWVSTWDVNADSVEVSLTARDRLSLLQQTSFNTSAVYENLSFGSVAEIILLDAGLKAEDFVIDSVFYTIVVPYMWFGRVKHFEAIRQLASACICQVYCDRLGRVVFKDITPPAESVYEFTSSNTFSKSFPLQWAELTNNVEITSTIYRKTAMQEMVNSLENISFVGAATLSRLYSVNALPVMDMAITKITSATLSNNCLIVGISAPTEIAYDTEYSVTVKLQNTGYSSLSASLLKLAITGDASLLLDTDVDVLPGEIKEYKFNVVSPGTGPTSSITAQALYDGYEIGLAQACTMNLDTAVIPLNGYIVDTTVLGNLLPDAFNTFSVTAYNSGSNDWSEGALYSLRCIVLNSSSVQIVDKSIAVSSGQIIRSGSTAVFDVSIDVPNFVGPCTMILQMQKNDVGLFGRELMIDLEQSLVSAEVVQSYAWGAEVLFTVTDACVVSSVVLSGKTLETVGTTVSVASDENAIRSDGLINTSFSHEFIQNTQYAQDISNTVLGLYKNSRRSINIDSRGCLALQIGDRVDAVDANGNKVPFIVKRQQLEYAGSFGAVVEAIPVQEV